MSEPTGFAIGKLLSGLTGRKVTVAQAAPAVENKVKQMFGVYKIAHDNAPIVMQCDLALLASLAGIMVGLPDEAVRERLASSTPDELLRDAMHEVLNVSATVVSAEERAVFIKMMPNPAYIDGAAAAMLKKPGRRSYFDVQVDGYVGGRMAIFANLPVLASS
jgi:hypothetical protein